MNTTTPATEASSQVSASSPKVEFGNFGKGRYAPVMEELFNDTIRLLKFSKPQAHVTSSRLGVDLGRLTGGQVSADNIKLGAKPNKDGYRTVREVCSIKMPNSWALSIAVICNGLDNLRKQGLECNDNSVNSHILEFVNAAALKLTKE